MALIKKLVPEGDLRDTLERWHAVWRFGYRAESVRLEWPKDGSGRPRVLLLADKPGWAFDTQAQAVKRHLSARFDIRIAYSVYRPDLRRVEFDLLFVLSADEFYHRRLVSDPDGVIKEIAHLPDNLERAGGARTIEEALKFLASDASTIVVICEKLRKEIAPWRSAFLVHQGIEPQIMRRIRERSGPLTLGWVGNVKARHKGVKEVLIPASRDFGLKIASGGLSVAELVDFYNSLDVICLASTVEGGPLPLLEGMACGCFPVATDVGIVPELVENGVNGLIVERNVDAFKEAFRWCAKNIGFVREAGRLNSERAARECSWAAAMPSWERVIDHALAQLRGAGKRRGA